MQSATTISGQCHCGNATVSLSLSKPAVDTPLRACQCTFCRRHGATSLSDPEGEAVFRFGAEGIRKYNFGLKVTDFLICPNCGVYVAATMPHADGMLAVINPTGLGMKDFLQHEITPMDYDGEDTNDRLGRRKEKWMPARIES